VTTKRNIIVRRFALVGVAAALLLSAPFASGEEQKQFQLNEKVSEALGKLKPLQDTKNFAGMLDLVNGQLKNIKPDSYDAAYLLDLKAKIYLQLDQYNNAIAPWEEALRLSEQYGYKDQKERLDITKYLAQLIFSEATQIKDKQQQDALVTKSAQYLKRYLDHSSKPEPEVEMLYAQILYYQATSDAQHINQPLLTEARQIVEKGMLGSIKPKEGFYLLLLAILQQQNDHEHSAEVMELLLSQYPQKKDVWPMLFGTYVNLAGSAKAESPEQRQYYVRAINTLERAQSLGYMNTPRDNYNLFTLYVNAGEINLATDLLWNGMKKGTIESTPQNWRVLGAYLQQANKELQAITALQEATKLYPKDGGLNFMIGQIYQQLDKIKDARDQYKIAVDKGNLGDKPHQAWLFLAYTSLELEDYQGALKAINEAAKTPDGAKDPQVKSVKEGIEATIAEREAAKAAAKKA
jgi:tetratricopeptide (TPR) repeat protein